MCLRAVEGCEQLIQFRAAVDFGDVVYEWQALDRVQAAVDFVESLGGRKSLVVTASIRKPCASLRTRLSRVPGACVSSLAASLARLPRLGRRRGGDCPSRGTRGIGDAMCLVRIHVWDPGYFVLRLELATRIAPGFPGLACIAARFRWGYSYSNGASASSQGPHCGSWSGEES